VYKRLIEAEKSSLRAKDLTHQLLTFSKGGDPIKKATLLPELIKDAALLTIRGSNVKCDFAFSREIWPVQVDAGQMSQVITNLILNSEEAMPGGGVLKISCENARIGPDDLLPLKKGKYVKISVKDHGVGVPKKYLHKIFDPYFTTKQGGAGLGLATVYSIIKKHEGHITATSDPGTGTVMDIYLPACDYKVEHKAEKETSVFSVFTGRGRILLMDDEEVVRDAAGAMLQGLGYEVEFAHDGKEAVERYRQAKESNRPFDVAVIDLTIPGGMGGREAIKKLFEVDPMVKAIVSSGYSDDQVMANYLEYGFKAVLIKPYDLSALSEAVHRVMLNQ
jgi:CheY-like chemotaxis protein